MLPGNAPAVSRTHDLSITSPTPPLHYRATQSDFYCIPRTLGSLEKIGLGLEIKA